MNAFESLWNSFSAILKIRDKLDRTAETVKVHQEKLEGLHDRLVRVEVAAQYGMMRPRSPDRRALSERLQR